MISKGDVQKVIGEVRVTLYEGGLAKLEAEQNGTTLDLVRERRFVNSMLKAGQDALSRHLQARKRILVPTR